jgi:hypothetical protein
MCFVCVGPTLRFGKEWGFRTPLNVNGLAYYKNMFRDDLQSAGSAIGRWLNDFREHLSDRLTPSIDRPIWGEELHIIWELLH